MADFNLVWPEREERDQALGRYLDAIARMERMLQMVIQELLDLDGVNARPIFATLMTKQSIDLLGAAAKTVLKENDANRVTKLCVRIGKRNMRRNHIIHGYWTCHFPSEEPGTLGIWVRVYDNVDPSLGAFAPLDDKLIGTYNFTIPALDKATGHAEEMVQALSVLLLDTPQLLAQRYTSEEKWGHLVSARLSANAAIIRHPVRYQIR